MTEGTTPQLDLFADSRDVMLHNDLIDALVQCDVHAAAAARAALAAEDAQHQSLPAADVLISALRAARLSTQAQRFADVLEANAARQHLVAHLRPAARSLLGTAATGWLTAFWRSLAERAAGLPFVAAQADVHAAGLWLQAGAAVEAAAAVQRVESWRRIPQPLAWMVQARHATDGLDAVWPLLCELAWMAPGRAAACMQLLADPLLTRLMSRFEADFEADVATESAADEPDTSAAALLAWFPAWLANDKPALLVHLRLAERGQASAAEQGFWLVAESLGLERQGRHAELINQRKRLRDLRPGLYASYMRTR